MASGRTPKNRPVVFRVDCSVPVDCSLMLKLVVLSRLAVLAF